MGLASSISLLKTPNVKMLGVGGPINYEPDARTVVDDVDWASRVSNQLNLPGYVKAVIIN
jgi:hypothetical protein